MVLIVGGRIFRGKPYLKSNEKGLKALFCRQGSKYIVRDKIIPYIPPHKIYVELFAGSGAIFFSKEKAEENILNDLDRTTYNNLKAIKNAPIDPNEYTMDISTIDKTKQFYTKHINTKNNPATDLILKKIISCAGFNIDEVQNVGRIYRPFSIKHIVDRIPKLNEKLKGVKILNQDYAKVVDKYNTVDTFFFIDPPYENTDKSFKYAEDIGFDFNRLADTLRKIKGKFFMTINDSKNIREIFKEYNIKSIGVVTKWSYYHKTPSIRKELFITNYKI